MHEKITVMEVRHFFIFFCGYEYFLGNLMIIDKIAKKNNVNG